jgi:hypothetical protein
MVAEEVEVEEVETEEEAEASEIEEAEVAVEVEVVVEDQEEDSETRMHGLHSPSSVDSLRPTESNHSRKSTPTLFQSRRPKSPKS